ncbi:HhH-GPD-type base excision DNA repair protein [Nocardioides litoris]|uniref:HhH-GPD-type base excision DNA repair protein n=1 Tax=Nocardioides litoris TaxID=1926648 RepID=UPI001B8785B3|nr:HhH-GPD-type base excision DNA repair protein [Nocardioides litoris]
MAIHTGDDTADQLLRDDPFALLAGMMLDQQYPMEHAFRGPAKVVERFGTFDPQAVADADPDEFAALCSQTPAIHRFPGSMAARLQELARLVVEEYDGHAERIWTEAADGRDLAERLQALPGFGAQKARIFVAVVAKHEDVRPEGWEKAAGDYALDGFRSVADVVDAASLQKVRDFKKEQKAAAKASPASSKASSSSPSKASGAAT